MNIQIIQDGILITTEGRCYAIKNIQFGNYQLKAHIRAYPIKQDKDQFHLDVINLYSSGARRTFIRECAALFTMDMKTIEKDINQIINIIEERKEELQKAGNATSGKVEYISPKDRGEAIEYLMAENLFDNIVTDLSALGYVGEDTNKLTAYLAVTSRKLDDPLSVMIISRSAAGKSSLQDAILSLLPTEDFIKYTALTGKALFYHDEFSLQNKVLAIEEEAGSREASYSIRAIQSSKFLTIATTGRDGTTGKLKTESYQVRGPVSIFLTTSKTEMDPETANRFMQLTIDESPEQTQMILQRQRLLETLDGLIQKEKAEKIITKHQNMQRLLAPVKVVNPFAADLTFSSETLRTRRDHKKYLNLIKVIAFLHQYQRKQKTAKIQNKEISYIEVIPADIERANQIAEQVFKHALDELSPPGRALIEAVKTMMTVKKKGHTGQEKLFTRKDIRDFTRWSHYQVKHYIKELLELEYLIPVWGGERKRHYYQIASNNGHCPVIKFADAAKLVGSGSSLSHPDFSCKNCQNRNLGAGQGKR